MNVFKKLVFKKTIFETNSSWFWSWSGGLDLQAAIIGELVTSGRASETLLMVYYPFLGLAVLAILRGLLSRSSARSTPTSAKGLASRKKRAWLKLCTPLLSLSLIVMIFPFRVSLYWGNPCQWLDSFKLSSLVMHLPLSLCSIFSFPIR